MLQASALNQALKSVVTRLRNSNFLLQLQKFAVIPPVVMSFGRRSPTWVVMLRSQEPKIRF